MQHDHDAYRENDGAVHAHVHPISLYLTIFGALIALTVLTVLTSDLDLDRALGSADGTGGFDLSLAMLIATVKASLVAIWFMHLKDDSRFNALVFIGSVLFAGIFFAYTLNDTGYRGTYDQYNGVHVLPSGERAPGGYERVLPGQVAPAGMEQPEAPAHHE